MPLFEYTAIINYYDKNEAERTERRTVKARNLKEAVRKLKQLGKTKSITWEKTPGLTEDLQLEMFQD